MNRLLLDTNALIYLANGEPISAGSVDLIALAQKAKEIYVSPFAGWELGVSPRRRLEHRTSTVSCIALVHNGC